MADLLLKNQQIDVEALKEKIICKCEDLLPRDIADNKSMGLFGAKHILKGTEEFTKMYPK